MIWGEEGRENVMHCMEEEKTAIFCFGLHWSCAVLEVGRDDGCWDS